VHVSSNNHVVSTITDSNQLGNMVCHSCTCSRGAWGLQIADIANGAARHKMARRIISVNGWVTLDRGMSARGVCVPRPPKLRLSSPVVAPRSLLVSLAFTTHLKSIFTAQHTVPVALSRLLRKQSTSPPSIPILSIHRSSQQQ
jgi:hypothetical protein